MLLAWELQSCLSCYKKKKNLLTRCFKQSICLQGQILRGCNGMVLSLFWTTLKEQQLRSIFKCLKQPSILPPLGSPSFHRCAQQHIPSPFTSPVCPPLAQPGTGAGSVCWRDERGRKVPLSMEEKRGSAEGQSWVFTCFKNLIPGWCLCDVVYQPGGGWGAGGDWEWGSAATPAALFIAPALFFTKSWICSCVCCLFLIQYINLFYLFIFPR